VAEREISFDFAFRSLDNGFAPCLEGTAQVSVVIARQRALLGLLAVAASALAAAPQTSAQETPLCFGETPTIIGTSGRDDLKGTKGRDVIQALAGDDVVHALGGEDVVCGGLGDDRLFAGAGDDAIHDEDGDDLLDGEGGDDRLYGNYGDDVMRGGAGDDELWGGNGDDEDLRPGRDRMSGGSGNDLLSGGQGDDRLDGGSGDDQLQAGFDETRDRVDGGKGDDRLEGSAGADKLSGGSGDDAIDAAGGNDEVSGGAGADELGGGEGGDELSGGPGADRLLGRGGDDRLKGGPGDDFLSGGEGEDELDGGPGQNQIVDDTLGSLIAAGGRDEIRGWATSRSIATLNAEVSALSVAERDRLAEIVLDTNATGENRDKMLRVMKSVLSHSELGFYAEIWSYTLVELTGNGFFGGCNHLFLSPDAWAGLSDSDATAVLMHESFHSFNCVNGGPVGSLDEGSAIWVVSVGLHQPLLPGQSLAETTYGSKLYHKVFFNNPNLPITAPLNPTSKLLEVYEWLAASDPSRLPWNSTERLVTCFERYFDDLDRNVDFFSVWLPAVKERTDQMLADAECKPL
jgi:Ca2+-binding RTX toxin-like protein